MTILEIQSKAAWIKITEGDPGRILLLALCVEALCEELKTIKEKTELQAEQIRRDKERLEGLEKIVAGF